jgi:hypothetical protein
MTFERDPSMRAPRSNALFNPLVPKADSFNYVTFPGIIGGRIIRMCAASNGDDLEKDKNNESHYVPANPNNNNNKKIALALLSSVANPGVLAGAGSTVVTSMTHPASSVAFSILTSIAFYNTYRSHINRNTVVSIKGNKSSEEGSPKSSQEGIKGLLHEVIKSPGVFSACQSLIYFGTSSSALVQGKIIDATAFGLMGLGAVTVYHLCNIGHGHDQRKQLKFESKISEKFHSLSKNAQNVMRNPGVYFPAANLLLIVAAPQFSNMSPVATAMFGISCVISGVGILGGLAPLVSKFEKKESGFSMIMAAVNDFMLATSSLLGGFNVTGLATVLWGLSGLSGGISTEIRSKKKSKIDS